MLVLTRLRKQLKKGKTEKKKPANKDRPENRDRSRYQERKHLESAKRLYSTGRKSEAAKMLGENGMHSEAAQILEELEESEQAAKMFEKANRWEKAAAQYIKVKMFDQAARAFQQSGNLEAAAEIFERLKNDRELVKIYKKLGRYREAISIYLKYKKVGRAVAIMNIVFHNDPESWGQFDASPDEIRAIKKWIKAGNTEGHLVSKLHGAGVLGSTLCELLEEEKNDLFQKIILIQYSPSQIPGICTELKQHFLESPKAIEDLVNFVTRHDKKTIDHKQPSRKDSVQCEPDGSGSNGSPLMDDLSEDYESIAFNSGENKSDVQPDNPLEPGINNYFSLNSVTSTTGHSDYGVFTPNYQKDVWPTSSDSKEDVHDHLEQEDPIDQTLLSETSGQIDIKLVNFEPAQKPENQTESPADIEPVVPAVQESNQADQYDPCGDGMTGDPDEARNDATQTTRSTENDVVGFSLEASDLPVGQDIDFAMPSDLSSGIHAFEDTSAESIVRELLTNTRSSASPTERLAFAKCKIFEQLDQEVIHQLWTNSFLENLKKNDSIHTFQDHPRGLYIILSGSINGPQFCITDCDLDGKLKASDFFGEHALIDFSSSRATYTADANCLVAKISTPVINRLVQKNPKGAVQLYKNLTQYLLSTAT